MLRKDTSIVRDCDSCPSISCVQYKRGILVIIDTDPQHRTKPPDDDFENLCRTRIYLRYNILYKSRCTNTERIWVDQGGLTLLKKVFHAFYSRRRPAVTLAQRAVRLRAMGLKEHSRRN